MPLSGAYIEMILGTTLFDRSKVAPLKVVICYKNVIGKTMTVRQTGYPFPGIMSSERIWNGMMPVIVCLGC